MSTGDNLFEMYCDDLGPEKIIHIYEPRCGLKAVLVVDNVAAGPSIGGIRMAADVTTDEVFRLARAMTRKNASASLAHGGGKAGIIADPKTANKEQLIRAFAQAIREVTDYIPGPDMGTDEVCMGYIRDEIGRSVGLPRTLGGIPLDELGATGYGVAQCALIAAPYCDLDLKGARVAIEGFGNVGKHAARFLEELGAVLIAATDSGGGVHAPDGMSSQELADAKRDAGSVTGFNKGKTISKEELFEVPADILVPAARPDTIHEGNVASIQAKLLLQGANIPATAAAEQALHDRGVLSIPDFVANAGGVICAAAEYHGSTETAAFADIKDKIQHNTQTVLERCKSEGLLPRTAANALAEERIREAMSMRRTY